MRSIILIAALLLSLNLNAQTIFLDTIFKENYVLINSNPSLGILSPGRLYIDNSNYTIYINKTVVWKVYDLDGLTITFGSYSIAGVDDWDCRYLFKNALLKLGITEKTN